MKHVFIFRKGGAVVARRVGAGLAGLGLALLPGLALAQLAISGTNPVANANAAPAAGPVAVTFNQAVTFVGATDPLPLRVFSAQCGGLRSTFSGVTSISGAVLRFVPGAAFRPGEVVQATVTTAATAAAGGTLAVPRVLQFTAAAGAGPGTFGGGSDVAVGRGPSGVAAADVDGDGDLDILTANAGDSTVGVRLNAGAGTFAGGARVPLGGVPRSLAVADVDGDGDLDVLAVIPAADVVRVRLNNGAGTFSGGSDVPVGVFPYGVAAADVDGDGDLDILANNFNVSTVSVRLNNGAGTFGGGTDVPVVGNPYTVAAADVNGDGALDILTANQGTGTVSVRLNGGAGTFSGGVEVPVGNSPNTVVAADVDGDGDLDILAASFGTSTVSVRLNGGAGTFTGTANVPVGSNPLYLAAGDVDGDGDLDILTANYSDSTASVRLNAGAGTFGGGADVPVGRNPFGVAAADVDGDGALDLLVANHGPGTVSVRLNQALVDLTISTGTAGSPIPIAAGTYRNVTVTATGHGRLAGAVVASGAVLVQGGLDTNCQALTGPGSFALAAGATLGICDADGISASGSTGAVRLTGTRAFSADASYVYNGTLTFQDSGDGLPATVRALVIDNALDIAGGLLLGQALAIRRELRLTRGNLGLFATFGGAAVPLALLSDATGTALVVETGQGRVVGSSATAQRYLVTANPGLGYRHYSSPVSGNTLAGLATRTFAPVFDAAYNTRATPHQAAGFPTVFGYDQARLTAATASPYAGFDRGWFSPLATDAFAPGAGYAVNLRGTEVVALTGTPNTGNYARTLARAPGSTGGEGLHLVGNPYPAPIDWSLVAPADRPGVDAAFYVFESTGQYTGAYRSAVNGLGSSTFIGMGQGFFVRVSPGQAAGTLTFRNAHRLTDYAQQVPVRRGTPDPRPQLRLTLAATGSAATVAADDLYLYAQTGATAGVDAEYDAVKLPNPSGLNLASRSPSGEALAIDGRASFGAATAIPLQVAVPQAGRYAFAAAAVANLPANARAELVDNLTGTRTVLAAGATYAFTTAATTAPGRFWLNLTPAAAPLAPASAAALAAQALAYPNPSTGRLTVLRPAGAAAQAVLLNALGQVVRKLQLPTPETTLDLRGLPTGVYTLRLTLDGQPVSKRVVFE